MLRLIFWLSVIVKEILKLPFEGFGKTLILNSVLSNIYSAIVWHPLVSVTMTKYVPEFGFRIVESLDSKTPFEYHS